MLLKLNLFMNLLELWTRDNLRINAQHSDNYNIEGLVNSQCILIILL